jgi:FtsZ-binding cell division protein ZapB
MSQDLATALQNCKEELETLLQSSDKLKAEIAQLQATIGGLVEPQELEILLQSIDQLGEELEALRESNDQLQTELETLQQSNDQYRVELDALLQSNDQLRAELETLRRSNHHLRGEFETLRQTNDELRRELAQLKSTTREVKKPLDLVIGSFHTDDIRPRNQPEQKCPKEIIFETPYPEKPSGVLLGLTDIDVANGEHVRIYSYTSNIRSDRFTVHLDTWEVANLHGCGCAWLAIAADHDPDLRFGAVAWDQPWTTVMERFARKVSFENEYPFPPVVVVWLSALAMDKRTNWRVKTYASQVTTDGFTLHIDTWGDSLLYGAESTWLAYPADTPRVLSGSFNTLQVRLSHPARQITTGTVDFGNTFQTTPRVFVALNYLDMDHVRNLRFFMRHATVDRSKMDWSLNTWDDSILYAAGASYIAMG